MLRRAEWWRVPGVSQECSALVMNAKQSNKVDAGHRFRITASSTVGSYSCRKVQNTTKYFTLPCPLCVHTQFISLLSVRHVTIHSCVSSNWLYTLHFSCTFAASKRVSIRKSTITRHVCPSTYIREYPTSKVWWFLLKIGRYISTSMFCWPRIPVQSHK